MLRHLLFTAILLGWPALGLVAADPATTPAKAPSSTTTDPNYRLNAGDTIGMSIFEEPDLAASQVIARSGEVRLPLIGEVKLIGKSVREAERLLESTYFKRQFLRDPVVNIVVTAYFPREISVLGAVRSPGPVVFPNDVSSLDIVEVLTRVGGFLPISKSDAVTITHRTPEGTETVVTVNLEDIMSGRHQSGKGRANMPIYPGDRIWVPERLF